MNRWNLLFLGILLAAGEVAYAVTTTTPIKHIIVIFQENRTFDHYFGIYPNAQNNPGETPFYPSKNTPSVNGFSPALLTQNPNFIQPFRLAPSQVNTCDPNHAYNVLQLACNGGLMNMFVQTTGASCMTAGNVMGYYDGNTVTALWNYAQNFALNDNCHTTVLSQSTIGAINLASGQTNGANMMTIGANQVVDGTIIQDIDPIFDMCSGATVASLSGVNVGNLLNAKGITWGWFQGGFANCTAQHMGPNGLVTDYVAHHNPFQFYQSTSNPQHLPPSSTKMIGQTDQANHNYDISYLWTAAEAGNLPSVCFLKAPAYQDGHGGNSSPLLEQTFLVTTINKLQTYPEWKNMAIIITYDDSGGWYDHVVPPIFNQSMLSNGFDTFASGTNALNGEQGRPAYGFRIPFLLISPWAKTNYVDSTLIDQTSVLRFIEDNWSLGRIGNFSFDAFAGSIQNMFDFKQRNLRVLMLHPTSGSVLHSSQVK